MTDGHTPRRTFLPVVVAGLAASGLTAVAAAKPWFSAAVAVKLQPGIREPDTAVDMPLALALALVVLAAWGALLVTRGAFRRLVAGLGGLAAAGVLACAALAPFRLPDQLRAQLGAGRGSGLADVAVQPTAWYVTALVAGILSLGVVVAAWVLVPRWPAMGSRYDAPGARRTTGPIDPEDPRAAWAALDEGRDPTNPEAD